MTAIDLTKPEIDSKTEPAQEDPSRIGANELGRIDIEPRAVEKIAALAAAEVPDAGGALGKARGVPGAGYLGLRRSALERLPRVSAEIDGALAFLEVELSVRWPVSVTKVTQTVRDALISRVGILVGLDVREVNVTVVDFITEAPVARVS